MPFKREPYPEADLEDAVMVSERVTFVAPDGTSIGTAEFSALE